MRLKLSINGKAFAGDAQVGETLLELLRRLGFKSVKKSCEMGGCGACTVLLDGRPVSSCVILAAQANGRSVLTVEGLGGAGELHPVQRAFVDVGAPQCGFCTPGMIMTAVAFLAEHPDPTRRAIREAISGNICRCSGYVKVVDAIIGAARSMREKDTQHE